MDTDYSLIIIRLLLALAAGGIIGLERAFHGREAGFRTHTLVCVSASLLMVLMVNQWYLVPEQFLDTVRADPTRMAQGIMTGIGFLGAGVIIKEGISVRGLTTAASIWMTASIGIVIGLGFYFAAFMATAITFTTLSLFRWVEDLLPSQTYARFCVRYLRHKEHADEEALHALLLEHHITPFQSSYTLDEEGRYFRYEMTIRTKDSANFKKLAASLVDMEDINEFRIVPS